MKKLWGVRVPSKVYLIPQPGGTGDMDTLITLQFRKAHPLLSGTGGKLRQIPRIQAARILWTYRDRTRI